MEADCSLCVLIREQFHQEVSLAKALVAQIPPAAAPWKPEWPAGAPPFTVQALCWHLCDALSGVCAVLAKTAAEPDPRAEDLRARLRAGSAGTIEQSADLLAALGGFADSAFRRISDADLSRSLPTVFAASGKPVLTLLLTNLTHFTNHKYQLFVYLRMLGVPVETKDLYRFDG